MNKRKHSLKKVIVIAFLPFFIGGCINDLFKQDDKTFTGQDQVEFKPTTNTVDARVTQSDNAVIVSPLLQLISSKGTLSSDISVEYAVNDSSTAIKGTDYSIISSSPLTIASGKVSVKLKIEVMAEELNDGETRILDISQKDISGGDVIPAGNFKTYTLIIRGVTD